MPTRCSNMEVAARGDFHGSAGQYYWCDVLVEPFMSSFPLFTRNNESALTETCAESSESDLADPRLRPGAKNWGPETPSCNILT